MPTNGFLSLIGRKKPTIFLSLFMFVLVASALTFTQPLKYGAYSQLLVVQDFDSDIDPYTGSKSTEYLSNVLARVTESDAFFRDVMTSGFNIDQDYFPERADKKMKLWSKTVDAKAINDTGIISVSVYHEDRYQLEQISRAVNHVLRTKNGQYRGGGNKVAVKVIDEPVISNWPAKPNVILNYGLALAFGTVWSLVYIYLFPEEKYDLRLWPRRRSKPEQASAIVEVPAPACETSFSHPAEKTMEKIFETGQAARDFKTEGSMKNIL